MTFIKSSKYKIFIQDSSFLDKNVIIGWSSTINFKSLRPLIKRLRAQRSINNPLQSRQAWGLGWKNISQKNLKFENVFIWLFVMFQSFFHFTWAKRSNDYMLWCDAEINGKGKKLRGCYNMHIIFIHIQILSNISDETFFILCTWLNKTQLNAEILILNSNTLGHKVDNSIWLQYV